ncbi:transcription factor bHLH30-like [Vitis riparia]|uniref:transcription factor bHLH30-like n=1 Tax=Vitis riparia TaxID=96939 RepID=UPI00155B0734|nr:transcription factor bHLH30-like [Vitis riparia]
MLPFQSYYEPVQRMKLKLEDGDSGTKVEGKSTAACNSHSEAERRRRQRINAHLSTLRTLLPNTTKTDKASLLAEVVRHVTELRKRAADVAEQNGDGCCSGGGSESWTFPGETDEVTLGYYEGDERLIKATLCCEDRPSLNRDLTQAIGSVRARVVRAEMATVGGRTKSVVVMQWGGGGEAELGNLRRALKAVVENRASGFGSTGVFPLHKRPRFSTSNASS